MPNTIKHIRQLFDEHHEIAAWLIIIMAGAGRWFDKIEDWPMVAMIAISMLTLLGVERFRGVRVGPGGVEVSDGKD